MSLTTFGQSTTYKNVYGTNFINGKTGNFTKSSFSWVISQKEKVYNIKATILEESFNVTYSYFDSANKLYVYKVVGNARFDNNHVKLVMTNGKLSDYAEGVTGAVNLLAILFAEDYGLMYKLNK
jgi:hypothetical protein